MHDPVRTRRFRIPPVHVPASTVLHHNTHASYAWSPGHFTRRRQGRQYRTVQFEWQSGQQRAVTLKAGCHAGTALLAGTPPPLRNSRPSAASAGSRPARQQSEGRDLNLSQHPRSHMTRTVSEAIPDCVMPRTCSAGNGSSTPYLPTNFEVRPAAAPPDCRDAESSRLAAGACDPSFAEEANVQREISWRPASRPHDREAQ